MVMLYVEGKKVGSLDENLVLFRQFVESGTPVEFRTDDGIGLGVYRPAGEPFRSSILDVTEEELDRAAKEPGGMTLAEYWQRRRG